MSNVFELNYYGRYYEQQGYDIPFMVLECAQMKDLENNASVIKWVLKRPVFDLPEGTPPPSSLTTGATTLTIGNEQVYFKERVAWDTDGFPAESGTSVSGTVTIPHNRDGSKTIAVSLSTAVYYQEIETVSETWTLNETNCKSSVSQNPADVESMAVCVISAYNPKYTHDVTYQFGTLTGTVVSGVAGGSYAWELPETFYGQIGATNTSKNGTLTCKTYVDDELIGTSTCTFTATVGAKITAPIITAMAYDTDEAVLALTGDNTIIIPGFSDVHCSMGAEAQHGAAITSIKITNGSKSFINEESGTFENTNSYKYTFYATDSRGLMTTESIALSPLVVDGKAYVKPYYSISDIDFSVEGKLSFNISGYWWERIFPGTGKVNTANFQYRYMEEGGSYSNWITVPIAAYTATNPGVFSDETITITRLNYTKAYTIQTRVYDALTTVDLRDLIVRSMPVFDWGKGDFNFNVPVNFNAGVTGIKAEDIDGGGLRYGTCSTAAATADKVVVSDGFPATITGVSIRVKFSYGNSATYPTLNVNGTGAYPIVDYASSAEMAYKWYSGEVKDFVFDGSNWVMVDGMIATTTYYGKTILTNDVDTSEAKAITPYGVQKYVKQALSDSGGESGVWTPYFSTGISSHTTRQGWYQKIGNVVTAGFYIVATSAGSSENITINGLPFSPKYTACGGGHLAPIRYTQTAAFYGWLVNTSGVISPRGMAITSFGSAGTSNADNYFIYPTTGTTMYASGTICFTV